MPANVEATVTANAPKEAVWKVLADFQNIANYTDTVRSSHSTSEKEFEIGSTRHCELAPAGSADEIITDIKQGEVSSYQFPVRVAVPSRNPPLLSRSARSMPKGLV